TAGARDAQANLVPDGQRAADPGLFSKALLTPHKVHDDVGTKSMDLKTPLRVEVPKPVERGGGQEMDRRAVEKRPRWEREIGDRVPVVQACDIRPVLFGLRRPGSWHRRLHSDHMAALCCSQCDPTGERLRERLVEIALLTGHYGAIGQRNADRRHLRAAARWLDEGGPEREETRPFSGVLGTCDLTIGAVQ